jgi:uncharacterized membrane protein
VQPGALDRMIRMAEQSQAAQIQVVEKSIEATARDVSRGHWLGFVTTLAAMGFAFGAAAIHEPVVAGVFLSVPVMAVAKALIESARPRAGSTPQPPPAGPTQRPK